jgi:hypothetical protein
VPDWSWPISDSCHMSVCSGDVCGDCLPLLLMNYAQERVAADVGGGGGSEQWRRSRTRARIPSSVRVRVGFDVKGIAKSTCNTEHE